MSVRLQIENERKERALAKVAKFYREWLAVCGDAGQKEFAKSVAAEYIAAIDIYVTLTGEEEFTVIEYVSNHLTD